MAAGRRSGYRRGRPWALIEGFYGGLSTFLAIHQDYEREVARLVAERGIPRAKLRLTPAETTALFDTRRLEQLIRERILPLRDAAHAYFRESDVAEPFDSIASKIYHELSILKEEHLSVRDFPRGGDGREFARLFREVSEYYPQRLRRVKDLLERAGERLREILPQFREDAIVLRSSFLFRGELWPDAPEAGLVRFWEAMFPSEGPFHGFLEVGRSFLRAGFFAQAEECARLGAALAGREKPARSTRGQQQLRDGIRELDKLAARARTEASAMRDQAS